MEFGFYEHCIVEVRANACFIGNKTENICEDNPDGSVYGIRYFVAIETASIS